MTASILFAVLLLLPSAPRAQSAPVPDAAILVWNRANAFLKQVNHVDGVEPYLYPDSRFGSYQAWSARYQWYGTDLRTSGAFRRIFVVAPPTPPEQLAQAYGSYGSAASTMLDELFVNLNTHVLMSPQPFRTVLVGQIDLALRTLVPKDDGSLPPFHPTDCDYITQPIDALWFAVNAQRLLDDYGKALYGIEWIKLRERVKAESLRRGNRIKSFDEFRVLNRGYSARN